MSSIDNLENILKMGMSTDKYPRDVIQLPTHDDELEKKAPVSGYPQVTNMSYDSNPNADDMDNPNNGLDLLPDPKPITKPDFSVYPIKITLPQDTYNPIPQNQPVLPPPVTNPSFFTRTINTIFGLPINQNQPPQQQPPPPFRQPAIPINNNPPPNNSPINPNTPILDFFDGKIPAAPSNLKIAQVVSSFKQDFDAARNHTPWVFPDVIQPQINKNCPPITQNEINQFSSVPQRKKYFEQALCNSLVFYGFNLNLSDHTVSQAGDYVTRIENWGDTVHLGMTFSRILKAANYFGYQDVTENTLQCLCQAYHNNTSIQRAMSGYSKSLQYWKPLCKNPNIIY